jgi:hypothetical protein
MTFTREVGNRKEQRSVTQMANLLGTKTVGLLWAFTWAEYSTALHKVSVREVAQPSQLLLLSHNCGAGDGCHSSANPLYSQA